MAAKDGEHGAGVQAGSMASVLWRGVLPTFTRIAASRTISPMAMCSRAPRSLSSVTAGLHPPPRRAAPGASGDGPARHQGRRAVRRAGRQPADARSACESQRRAPARRRKAVRPWQAWTAPASASGPVRQRRNASSICSDTPTRPSACSRCRVVTGLWRTPCTGRNWPRFRLQSRWNASGGARRDDE